VKSQAPSRIFWRRTAPDSDTWHSLVYLGEGRQWSNWRPLRRPSGSDVEHLGALKSSSLDLGWSSIACQKVLTGSRCSVPHRLLLLALSPSSYFSHSFPPSDAHRRLRPTPSSCFFRLETTQSHTQGDSDVMLFYIYAS